MHEGYRFDVCPFVPKYNLSKMKEFLPGQDQFSRAAAAYRNLQGKAAQTQEEKPHGLQGRKAAQTVLTGYTAILDKLLIQGVTNAQVCLERLQEAGYPGGLTTVKDYIAAHRFLVPDRRQLVAPQGSRGQRFTTEPGEAFQMDWGFTRVVYYDGSEYQAACFAMICHHCGQRYVEFFPNAKQENLFIGMIHGFACMGIPLPKVR